VPQKSENVNLIPLLVPDVGDDSKIELISWNISIGDTVNEGDEICELVTDKASFPLESPENGVLHDIKSQAGTEVKVGQEIGTLAISADQK
jgi:pyruvate/2-oxoglutarate dehydrogenase complex dihydrolipoamide acyltransferase (E2) component